MSSLIQIPSGLNTYGCAIHIIGDKTVYIPKIKFITIYEVTTRIWRQDWITEDQHFLGCMSFYHISLYIIPISNQMAGSDKLIHIQTNCGQNISLLMHLNYRMHAINTTLIAMAQCYSITGNCSFLRHQHFGAEKANYLVKLQLVWFHNISHSS